MSTSLLDTTSLGLSGNGVQGNVITAGSANLNTAITNVATAKFTLAGPGFDMATIDMSSTFTAANVTNENQAVTVINAAIAAKATTNTALSAANIHASIDASTGKLVLSGNSAFSAIQAGAGATALLGAGLLNSGTSSLTQAFQGTITATNTLTFTWQNAAGANVSHQVVLSGAGVTQANAATQISNDAANGGIYAVVSGGNLIFSKGDGGAFTMNATQTGAAGKGVAAGNYNSVAGALGTATALDISSSGTASAAVTAIATAVTNLGTVQGTVGRSENQLGYAMNLAQSQLTNQTAAESRIRDADLASEAANLTKAQILMQAGAAALAQANSSPQVVLSLLKG